jgi:hypothetical protein
MMLQESVLGRDLSFPGGIRRAWDEHGASLLRVPTSQETPGAPLVRVRGPATRAGRPSGSWDTSSARGGVPTGLAGGSLVRWGGSLLGWGGSSVSEDGSDAREGGPLAREGGPKGSTARREGRVAGGVEPLRGEIGDFEPNWPPGSREDPSNRRKGAGDDFRLRRGRDLRRLPGLFIRRALLWRSITGCSRG